MKSKKIYIIVLLSVLIFLLGGCKSENTKDIITAYPLKITGDVINTIILRDLNKYYNLKTIDYNNKKVKAVTLKTLINESKPSVKDYDIMLSGIDGLSVKISNDGYEESYITYSKNNGWEAINKKHPLSSNVKMMNEIIVISNKESLGKGFNIISTEVNISSLTPGQLYTKDLKIHLHFEGKSKVEDDNTAEVFTKSNIFIVDDLINRSSKNSLVFGKKGEVKILSKNGYFKTSNNCIDYVYNEEKETIGDVAGVIVNTPSKSIMDAYYDSKHYIENNEKVMLIYVDGFSFNQYKYGVHHNYINYLSNYDVKEAYSVYKPVTNVGYAAMITGKTPAENGVTSREIKDLKCPSIFNYLKQQNKSSKLLESNIKILNTEIEPILNIDSNNNGTDDEIYECAYDSILNYNLDFLLVHFHGLDDKGHSYGPKSKEAMETLKRTDEYIKDLCAKWDGIVIITSDHGMHLTDDGGSHGEFRMEDMFIPYVIIQGGEES